MKTKFITIILLVITSMLMMTSCGSSVSDKPADVIVETEQTIEETAPIEESPQPEAGQTVPSNDPSDIGAEKVKQIVLAKVPGAVEASIYEFERDYDDGRLEYEGSIYHDGYEYEFEVDGATGNILKWEIDD